MKHYKEQLFKVLSRNDTGETGGHQSGISIPKAVAGSSIFPAIYYNDKYHGKPADKCHDEFRLTCTNSYIREHNIKAGDQIWFAIDDDGKRYIGFMRAGQQVDNKYREEDGMVILKIRSWTSIKKEKYE